MSEYENHSEDRDKVLGALGGKRGLLDSGLPSLLFLLVFTITKSLNSSLIAALIVAGVFTIARLIKRETIQHALSGLFGVAICALLSRHTGKAADFYLPGLWINIGYAAAYTVANIAGWPLLGIMLGPILGEDFHWRKVSARKKVYARAGWVWVALFGSRLLVQYPLYKSGNIGLLGTARLVMGTPLFAATAWLTWQILRKVPTAKPSK